MGFCSKVKPVIRDFRREITRQALKECVTIASMFQGAVDDGRITKAEAGEIGRTVVQKVTGLSMGAATLALSVGVRALKAGVEPSEADIPDTGTEAALDAALAAD